MLIDAEFDCAWCGACNATVVDPSAGRAQDYIEDCQICCRPNRLIIEIDETASSARIDALPENE